MVAMNRPRLYRTVYNLIHDPQEAEDIVQDTFIKVLESVGSFRGDAMLSTWLYKIAVRKSVERIRRRKLTDRVRAFLPSWVPQEKKSMESQTFHPGVALEKQERATALYKALDEIPTAQRMAFQLILVDGMPYSEACELLGVGIKAAESLVSRAKENLRKKLSIHHNH